MPDPRFEALQKRHYERGPEIRWRIRRHRALVAALTVPVIVSHLAVHVGTAFMEAWRDLRDGWRDAPDILLRADAMKLRRQIAAEKDAARTALIAEGGRTALGQSEGGGE